MGIENQLAARGAKRLVDGIIGGAMQRKSPDLSERSASSKKAEPVITHGRLVQPGVINSRDSLYGLDRRNILAVLDGHVVLEPECYTIDRESGTIRLHSPPAFGVSLLVQ